MVAIGSFLYGLFAVNNGHHAPHIVHEGDEFDNLDFGIFQMKAIVDREEVDDNVFTTLAYFGQHTLHHLFPTIDHAILPHFQKIFEETCKEFSFTPLKKTTIVTAMVDQFKQLGKTVPSKL